MRLRDETSSPRRQGLINMNRKILGLVVLWTALGACVTSRAEELKVDLGGTGRANTGARHFIEWQFNPANPLLAREGVTIRLRQTGEAPLQTGLYKFGLDYDARLAADGVTSRPDDANGGLEMIVTGLTPGLHTIATYHNSLL